ncbi:hypothetical protein Bhyg_02256, partial [Pseudolycoriella hygida]
AREDYVCNVEKTIESSSVQLCQGKRSRQLINISYGEGDNTLSVDVEPEPDDDNDINFEKTVSAHYKKQIGNQRPPGLLQKILNSADVTSAVDRAKLSTPKFTMIAAAIARACDEDINHSTISCSSVSRKRSRNRQSIVSNIREDFKLSMESTPWLIVHWDGKKMGNYNDAEDFDETEEDEKVDRIATVVIGSSYCYLVFFSRLYRNSAGYNENGTKLEQILEIAKSNDGTGATIAKIVYRNLVTWEAVDKVIGLCFDTTASNTEMRKGACILLQKKHHIGEVVLRGVFITLFGNTKSPRVEIFKRFKSAWDHLDKKSFQPIENKHFKQKFASAQRTDTIQFLNTTISNHDSSYIPRKDYLELMELCLLVLGHPIENYTFKACGADHHARWMFKLIYSFKIYLFRHQFTLTAQEEANLRNFCLFGCLLYVKYWIQCPRPTDAPINDPRFFMDIRKYNGVNKEVAESALNKFRNHMWYLSAELVVLALFSDEVSTQEKARMMTAMHAQADLNWNRQNIRLENIKGLAKKHLSDLVGPQIMPALLRL